jgi:YesN/AraC family two-component response regulator
MLQKVIKYIEENYSKDISLADAANFCGISSGYVGKLFREHTGDTTFKDYLNKFRVEKAKELILADKNIKINDIAATVGFLNTTTFIRVFKKYESITPGEYKISNI